MKANKFLLNPHAYDLLCLSYGLELDIYHALIAHPVKSCLGGLGRYLDDYVESKRSRIQRLRQIFKIGRKPIRAASDPLFDFITQETSLGIEMQTKELALAMQLNILEGAQVKRLCMLEEWAMEASKMDIAELLRQQLRGGSKEVTDLWRAASRIRAGDYAAGA